MEPLHAQASAAASESSRGPAHGLRLALIDDDLMSREVLSLLAAQAGFDLEAYESGDEAVAELARRGAVAPAAVLTDLQMPGLSGIALADRLRKVCGPATRILAMSGSGCPPETLAAFDDFLLKPFAMEQLVAAVTAPRAAGSGNPEEDAASPPADTLFDHLNAATYTNLAAAMKPEQLQALYQLCLDDAERRLKTMQQASKDRDGAAFVAAAHAVKGGCGMVGATHLAAIAARLEKQGLPEVDDSAPFEEFLASAARLRGMLKATVPR